MITGQHSTGEVAVLTGLSIRTLQYYDRIGLVPASVRTEGGRRYYDEADLLRLEQVMLYKYLGFSLEEIAEKLVIDPGVDALRKAFVEQQYQLLRKIENLHTAFAALDATLRVMDAGGKPSTHYLLTFLRALPGDDVWETAPGKLSENQQQLFSAYMPDFEAAQSFYRRWKEINIAADALRSAGVPEDNPVTQKLVMEWQSLIEPLVGITPDQFGSFGSISPEMATLNGAQDYLARALEIRASASKRGGAS